MEKRRALKVLMTSALSLPLLFGGTPSSAEEQNSTNPLPPGIQVKDGMTQPVFSHSDAILERVFVETEVDSDGDGKKDRVHADVLRPKETENGLKVPVIYEMSPYRSGIKNVPVYDVDVELNAVHKKGKSSEVGGPSAEAEAANLPGNYDDYFVPRGYAVVLAESIGTGASDGCPTTGDENETLATKAVIDWLNGRTKAFNEKGEVINADWSTGNVGMFGTSYNGTLPNAVATTGVEGLKTIVPIAAISSWYDYYRANGAVIAPGGYQGEDTDNMAEAVLTRKNPEACAKVIKELTEGQDRETGDYNDFWAKRDYTKDAENVKASVFVIHGLNDWNVKTKQFSDWWLALEKNDVPRKLWLHQRGHTSPTFRTDAWMPTLNKWFDYWLYDIKNDVMDQPMVDIQREDQSWTTEENWPAKGSENTRLFLKPSATDGVGSFSLNPVPNKNKQDSTFIDNAAIKAGDLIKNPDQTSPNRLAFTTGKLEKPVRLSGTPELNIRGSFDRETANLTALLVNYKANGSSEIVTRGWMDPQNLHDSTRSTALTAGREYSFKWDMQPDDYVFNAGDRLGVVIISSDNEYTLRPKAGTKISVDLERSEVILPLVGGKEALNWNE